MAILAKKTAKLCKLLKAAMIIGNFPCASIPILNDQIVLVQNVPPSKS